VGCSGVKNRGKNQKCSKNDVKMGYPKTTKWIFAETNDMTSDSRAACFYSK
jgi:hypothetical protein